MTCAQQTANGVEHDVPAPVAFISVVCMGAYGSMFSDFGPSFTIRDKTGEEVSCLLRSSTWLARCNPAAPRPTHQPVTRIVTNISPEGIVTVLNEKEGGKRVGVPDNDHEGWITFTDVKGCVAADGTSINDVPRMRARPVFDKYTDKEGRERSYVHPLAAPADRPCYRAAAPLLTSVVVVTPPGASTPTASTSAT